MYVSVSKSLTIIVPAAVPSLLHSAQPESAEHPWKRKMPPKSPKTPLGTNWQVLYSELHSCVSCTVPAVVPSVDHN